MRSDLLEEDDEPFEVFPGARLSSCLLVVLYILFSPATSFKGWASLEGDVIMYRASPARKAASEAFMPADALHELESSLGIQGKARPDIQTSFTC